MLAAIESESGMSLQVILVRSLGTQLVSDTLTVSVVVRIETPVCEPHVCRCGAKISTHGVHNLECRSSVDRFARHAELNDVVKRAFQKSGVPCVLEPPVL